MRKLITALLLFTAIVADMSSMKLDSIQDVALTQDNFIIEPEELTALALAIEPTPVREYIEPPYTTHDIELLAKTVWGEARGCAKEEWRLVVWTVLQRVDADDWGDTIEAVVTAKCQFIGYRAENPLDPAMCALVMAELMDWARGAEPPTHELYAPTAPYYFFCGDGTNNWFRAVW